MAEQQPRKLYEILSAPLVEWLRRQGFPMPQPPIRYYPDGSLWIDDHRLLEWTQESLIHGLMRRQVVRVEDFITQNLPGSHAAGMFRPLSAFGGDSEATPFYVLLYPGSCTWIGEGEHAVLMYPGIAKPPTKAEYELANVRVLVRLRRKFTAEIAKELAGALRQWFEEVGSQGVFGEAGLASISPAMRYLDRYAGFELDARGSGQETLNTLYLAVLNWGMNQRRPLVLTHLAADPNEPIFSSDLSVPLR